MDVLLIVTVSVAASHQYDMISSKFYNDKILCDLSDRQKFRCSYPMHHFNSDYCAPFCGMDTRCIGASVDENGRCFIHKECPYIFGCTIEHRNHRYWTKHCAHGRWDPSAKTCKCVDHFFGERCNQCYSHCRDLIEGGHSHGEYRLPIDPEYNGKRPFYVTCYVNSTAKESYVYMLKNNGWYYFNHDWIQYVRGFYIINDMWGGLYPWHVLTNTGCDELILSFKLISRSDHPTLYRTYKGFRVSNDSEKYSYSFVNTFWNNTGNVPDESFFGDCLGPLKNVPFSTRDADNDEVEHQNCANQALSGWWYKDCTNPCNLLGYGIQYWNRMPTQRLFSLLGVNMSSLSNERGMFSMVLKCN